MRNKKVSEFLYSTLAVLIAVATIFLAVYLEVGIYGGDTRCLVARCVIAK